MEFLLLSRRRFSMRNVPSGEEWGETDVFAGYLNPCTFDPLSLRKHVVMPQLVTLWKDAWGMTAEIQYWQGCTLAEPNGPWCLIFAPWQPENLIFFQRKHNVGHPGFHSFRALESLLRAQPWCWWCFTTQTWLVLPMNWGEIISLIAQLFKSTTKTWVVHIISMEFLQSFQRRHFGGKPVTASQNVGHFFRLWPMVSFIKCSQSLSLKKKILLIPTLFVPVR